MPLFCDLGWHRPEPVARWNDGYYFSRCARCGQDMVRTAYGRWHVPRGYRVVWQAQPPATSVSAALVHELPIQEVLRHLQNGDAPADQPDADAAAPDAEEPVPDRAEAAGDPPAEAAPAAPHELISRAVPAPRIPDFMDETTGASAWESPSRAYLMRPARADQGRDAGVEQEADRGPGPLSRLRARFTALVERDRGEAPPEPEEDRGPGPLSRLSARFTALIERDREAMPEPTDEGEAPARLSQNMRLALIAAVPIVLLLLVLVLWGGREDSRLAGANDSAAQDAIIATGAGEPAFVTASVLNCRAAPAREAESVKVLMRGDPVRLLARDAEWVSLIHDGGQCWALARYFSVERPI